MHAHGGGVGWRLGRTSAAVALLSLLPLFFVRGPLFVNDKVLCLCHCLSVCSPPPSVPDDSLFITTAFHHPAATISHPPQHSGPAIVHLLLIPSFRTSSPCLPPSSVTPLRKKKTTPTVIELPCIVDISCPQCPADPPGFLPLVRLPKKKNSHHYSSSYLLSRLASYVTSTVADFLLFLLILHRPETATARKLSASAGHTFAQLN